MLQENLEPEVKVVKFLNHRYQKMHKILSDKYIEIQTDNPFLPSDHGD